MNPSAVVGEFDVDAYLHSSKRKTNASPSRRRRSKSGSRRRSISRSRDASPSRRHQSPSRSSYRKRSKSPRGRGRNARRSGRSAQRSGSKAHSRDRDQNGQQDSSRRSDPRQSVERPQGDVSRPNRSGGGRRRDRSDGEWKRDLCEQQEVPAKESRPRSQSPVKSRATNRSRSRTRQRESVSRTRRRQSVPSNRGYSRGRQRRSPDRRPRRRSKGKQRRSVSEHRKRHRSDKRRRRGRSSSRTRKTSAARSLSPDSDLELGPVALAEKRQMDALTRDARTVLVTQLQVKVTERDLKSFFQTVCNVRSVVLLRDKNSNRSKGVGYVEVKTLEDVPKALMLDNQPFVFRDGHQSFPIRVKASEAEKNFNHQIEKIAAASQNDPSHAQLDVSNLHANVDESALRELFSTFGPLAAVKVALEGSLGRAAVHFTRSDHATAALRALNGTKLLGLSMRISPANAPTGSGRGWRLEDDGVEAGRSGGGGVSMDAQTREILMRNLAGGRGGEMMMESRMLTAEQTQRNLEDLREQAERAEQAASSAQESGAIAGLLSSCLRVRNMFDPDTEEGDDWEVEIKEDTISECAKFGKVVHCAVDKESKEGHVYIAFEDLKGAQTAAEKLHGRWFAKRMLQVEYLKPVVYKAKYKF